MKILRKYEKKNTYGKWHFDAKREIASAMNGGIFQQDKEF